MTEPEKLIHLLRRTSAPLGQKAVSRVVSELERLAEQDAAIEALRDATGLYDCPVEELAGVIEDLIGNLATNNAEFAARLASFAPEGALPWTSN